MANAMPLRKRRNEAGFEVVDVTCSNPKCVSHKHERRSTYKSEALAADFERGGVRDDRGKLIPFTCAECGSELVERT